MFCVTHDSTPNQCTAVLGFPINALDGSLVAVKYRNWSKQKDEPFAIWVEGDKSFMFGGLQNLNPAVKTVIITEGEPDYLSWMEVYYDDPTVAVTYLSGAKAGVRSIIKVLPRLMEFPNIVLAVDNDAAGVEALSTLKTILPPVVTKYITYPPGMDANDMWVKGMLPEMKALVQRATPVVPESVISYQEVLDQASTLFFDEEKRMGISTGFPSIDAIVGGYAPGRVIMLAGSTKDGKSTLVFNLMYKAILAGLKPYIIPLEMPPKEVLLQLMSIELRVSLLGDRNAKKLVTPQQFTDTAELFRDKVEFAEHFGTLPLDQFARLFRTAVKALGSKLVILDHITAATVNMDWRQLDEYMYLIKQLANELNVAVLVVSHVNTVQAGKRITKESLRGSRALTQVPNVTLGIERNDPFSTIYPVTVERFVNYTGEAVLVYYPGGRLVEWRSEDERQEKLYLTQRKEKQAEHTEGREVRLSGREGIPLDVSPPGTSSNVLHIGDAEENMGANSGGETTGDREGRPEDLQTDGGDRRPSIGEVHTGLPRPSHTGLLRGEGSSDFGLYPSGPRGTAAIWSALSDRVDPSGQEVSSD